jgi:hypothetical protein
MTAPIALVDLAVKRSCRSCGYAGCAQCCGRGYMLLDPYARRGGEQGDDFDDLHSPTDGGGASVRGNALAGIDPEKPSDARAVAEYPGAGPRVVSDLERALLDLVDRQAFDDARAGREQEEAGHG